jgi:hypothetical protein
LALALRALTFFEVLVRRGQEQAGEKLRGLYPGQASRTTEAPTAVRVLKAIAKTGITLTRVDQGDGSYWHLTPLPELLKRVLDYLGLPQTVYTRLVIKSSWVFFEYAKEEQEDFRFFWNKQAVQEKTVSGMQNEC